jgi:hypothetical protein
MEEEDYLTAINRLEYVICNMKDEVLIENALLDQAYCYKNLADSGERNLPVNCHAKTKTREEFIEFTNLIYRKGVNYNVPDESNDNKVLPGLNCGGNYPNPFNPETTIQFSLLESVPDVNIKIYNIKGQLVQKLLDSELDKGEHQIVWKGDTVSGEQAGSGVYFYQITAGEMTETRKMMLIK